MTNIVTYQLTLCCEFRMDRYRNRLRAHFWWRSVAPWQLIVRFWHNNTRESAFQERIWRGLH